MSDTHRVRALNIEPLLCMAVVHCRALHSLSFFPGALVEFI